MPTGSGERGFSLIGLLFVVAGLGVGMAALGTMWHTAAQREKERDLLFVGDQYARAIESFWNIPLPVGTPRRLPKTVAELLTDPRFPDTVRHLRRAWPDPMTGGEWVLLKGGDGGITGVASASEATPFKRANFPLRYAGFESAQRYRDWEFGFDAEKAAAAAAPPAPGAPATQPGAAAPTPAAPVAPATP
ncbi:MAG: type II secretion system protein [Gammaproteobacteria bacterium]